MDELSMACPWLKTASGPGLDRVSILEARTSMLSIQQEWQPCELIQFYIVII